MKGKRAFTLLELVIVVGIMGLLGSVSVSGFRGLKKGMEERGTMQVVDEFVRSAYRRAVIDRVPVSVYFWNETIQDDTESSGGEKLVVVGRAVAVRRAGRISAIDGKKFLIDEFGDLASDVYTDEEGKEDSGNKDYEKDPGRYFYKVGDTTFARSVVSSTTVRRDQDDYLMSRSDGASKPIRAYGYYLKDPGNLSWEVGDAYGFEIADLTLPKNYIFGSTYSTDVKTPEQPLQKVMVIWGSGDRTGLREVEVSGLQLDKSGDVAFKSIGTSADPKENR